MRLKAYFAGIAVLVAVTGCGPLIVQSPGDGLSPVNAVSQGDDKHLMLAGHDVVSYFTNDRHQMGSPEFKSVHEGVSFWFASAEHKTLFDAAPVKYIPQYGGYCAWAVSQGYTASTDPEAWKIVNDKLYLNYSKSVQARWEQDIPGNIEKGDANWPNVLN